MLEIPAKRKFSASLVNNQDRFYSNLFKSSVGTEKKDEKKKKAKAVMNILKCHQLIYTDFYYLLQVRKYN